MGLSLKQRARNLAACAAKALKVAARKAASARAAKAAAANAAAANDNLSILRLPNEIFLNIADNLEIEEMEPLIRTCKRMHNLLNDRLYRDAMQPGVVNTERPHVPGARPYDNLLSDHHLYTAAVRNCEGLTRLLELHNFDDEECDSQPFGRQRATQCTPLHPEDLLVAAVGAQAPTTTAIMLDYGVSAGAICPIPTERNVPMHSAALGNSSFLVNLLVSRGVPVDQLDLELKTALFQVVESTTGSAEMVKTLLEAGAEVDSLNDFDSSTPLQCLIIDMNREIIFSHEHTYTETQFRMAELLIDAGADMTGSGALHWAATLGTYDLLEFMVEKGADVSGVYYYRPDGAIRPTALETFELAQNRERRRALSLGQLPWLIGRATVKGPIEDVDFERDEERVRQLLTPE